MGKNFVTYEQFGAVGDGKHDDFIAIYKTHEYANANGVSVKGREGATYYIENTVLEEGAAAVSAVIQTDVDWTGVNFIIDDTKITSRDDFLVKYSKHIFHIKPTYDAVVVNDKDELSGFSIRKGAKKVDLGGKFNFPAFIIPEDDSDAIFRRYGYVNRLYGEPKREVIVIDKDGNVREDTPIIFDYAKLSKLSIYRIDETPITVKGGKFTTVRPRTDRWLSGMNTSYITRGMWVTRSNVTVEGAQKYFTGGVKYCSEFMTGKLAGIAYSGFFSAQYATDVTFKDCVMTTNLSYGHSTYAHNCDYANHVVYDHCELSNFWVKVDWENDRVLEKRWNEKTEGDGFVNPITRVPYASPDILKKVIDRGAPSTETAASCICWGSGGSNFCKNVQMINGTALTRFDAHQGLYNGVVRDSALRFIAIIGMSNDETPTNFVVENSTLFSTYNSLLYLRGDYGGTWQGNVSFKNVNVYVDDPEKFFVTFKPYYNWYFGYQTYFPNITLDNVTYYDEKFFDGKVSPKERGINPIEKPIPLLTPAITRDTRMHLKESHTYSNIEIRDKNGPKGSSYTLDTWVKTLSDGTRVIEPCKFSNGDGYIDEPWDMDGDGKIGNLLIDGKPIAVKDVVEYLNSCDQNWSVRGYCADGRGGFADTKLNMNITHAPTDIKVLNNEAGHKYSVLKTAGVGVPTSDESSEMGGFFGNTKFYYGEDEYLFGTDYTEEETENTPFIFE